MKGNVLSVMALGLVSGLVIGLQLVVGLVLLVGFVLLGLWNSLAFRLIIGLVLYRVGYVKHGLVIGLQLVTWLVVLSVSRAVRLELVLG